jgi:hypothetical protein
MWKFLIKSICYVFGLDCVEALCYHDDFDVRDEKVSVSPNNTSDTSIPIISSASKSDDKPDDKSGPIEMYKLVAIATCNKCGYEFDTWANGGKINKDGENDLNNIKRIDHWRYPPCSVQSLFVIYS